MEGEERVGDAGGNPSFRRKRGFPQTPFLRKPLGRVCRPEGAADGQEGAETGNPAALQAPRDFFVFLFFGQNDHASRAMVRTKQAIA